MKKILVIGGSNSKQSINKKLANYAADKIGETEKIKLELDNLNLPIYSVDLHEEKGIHEEIKQISNQEQVVN